MDEYKKDKSVSISSIGQDIIDISDIAKRDKYSHFLVKKTEKILKATYLITNFFDTREPLKWSLRDVSVSVLNKIVNLSYSSLGDREKNVLDFISESIKLGSMLETAGIAGLISASNFNILKQELEYVIRFVESKHETYYMTATSFALDKDFFDASIKDNFKPRDSEPQKRHTNNRQDIDIKQNHSAKLIKEKSSSDGFGFKGQASEFKSYINNLSNVPGNILEDRSSKIMDLAKKMDWFGIKDISLSLKNVSEKTIQRDLLQMVEKGVLEKSGERRWSRYKLAVK